jgi:uncharacterized protein YkwD
MKRTIVVLLACLLAGVGAFAQGMEEDILELVNKHRRSKGLAKLEMNSLINKEAEKHSRRMATGHVSFGHGGFDDRLDRLMKQIKGANAGAENVAYGSRTAEAVVNMWLNSAGHRKNIEGNYNLTGIGVIKGKDGTTYYTQIFIRQRR